MDENIAENSENKNFTAKRAIYLVLGLIEVLLAFRLSFRLLGANPVSGFASFIYSTTQMFLVPFTAVFRSAVTQGIETSAVLEPGTIIAMIVYALIAWGMVKLITVVRGRNESKV